MCGVSGVAGASGGGPPMKVGQSDVAGANGAAAMTMPMPAAKGGGPEGAADGASALGGGVGTLAAALDALKVAITKLAQAVQAMLGKTQVAGAQGTAALRTQFVARTTSTASSQRKEDNAFEQRVLELINAERARYGLGAVSYNSALDNAAEKHNEQMSIVGRMAHDGIGDGDPGERIRAEGWRRAWGENVATGQTSPEQVVREWMNSPEHRRNILDPSYKYMGVSYTTAANGRTYWAQEFGA